MHQSTFSTKQLAAALALALAASLPAHADRTTVQVGLAASGRFDQLEKQLEQQAVAGPLDTPDQHALCYAYSKTKRYAKLLTCLERLEHILKQGNKRTRLFALEDATPALHVLRAEAQVELGQYGAAIAQAKLVLAWFAKDGDGEHDMLCNAYAILSIAQTMSGAREAAVATARELEAVKLGFMSPYVSAKAMALGRARMALGDYAGVLDALAADKTLALNVFLDRLATGGFLSGENNWVWVELPRAFMQAKALFETGRLDQARASFERLLGIEQVRQNGEIYWLLLYERARLALRENQPGPALGWLRQAIAVVEEQRASINTEASKIGFAGDKQALYAAAIGVALQLDQTALAYELIERAKSRALVDLLAGKHSAAPLRAQDEQGQQALGQLEQAWEDAAAQHVTLAAGAAPERARALSAGRLAALKRHDPALASLVSVDALQLSEVRTHLQRGEVLVEYHLFGQDLVIVAVGPDQVLARRVDAAGLEAAVRRFRRLIGERSEAALKEGQQLYRQLLGPVAELIAGRDLIVVPHGALHYLPFAALHDGAGYLLDGRQLRYLPSASVHRYLRPPGAAALSPLLVLGNPDLGRADLDLPSAEQEARLIAALVPDSLVLTRGQASESRFRQAAPGYRYLHVAAHGQFKSDAPLASRLALAPDGANDGSLTVDEIYRLRLDADLVTLSACETGLNKAMNGDDLVGMTRGFLYAGSSNIVASLWEVDDRATADLMAGFYRALKAGNTKKAALQQAQVALRERYPDPVFWAAFYLTGHGQ